MKTPFAEVPRPLDGPEALARPGVLQRAVAELGALAAGGGSGRAARLGALGAPEVLDVLFRVALGSSLRRGPEASDEVGSPGRLVELAAEGAGEGSVPLVTVVELRSCLERLDAELRASGAWAAGAPLWWSPLPAPGELEALWHGFGDTAGVRFPADPELRAALADDGGDAPGWIAWPAAVAPALCASVAAELEATSAAGVLDLRGGGIGPSDLRSSRRSDEVEYVTGLEPALLARAPRLAVLVQRLLEGLEEALRRALPDRKLFAPQTCMLARYRAPSAGFAAHLDNPGGAEDNGRVLALVLYLNPPGRPCRGGGLAVWPAGAATSDPPERVLPPEGGSAVLFDARAVAHAVEPVAPGPDRWTLVLWPSDRRRRPPRPLLPVPEPSWAHALQALDAPPVAEGAVLLRRIEPGAGPDRITVRRPAPGRRPRSGVVATVRGAGAALEGWCRHHLGLGMVHLRRVVEEGAPPEEAELLADLRRRFGGDRFTVWTEDEGRRRRERLPAGGDRETLRTHAAGGAATWAVAARQALNASAGLAAARAGELGGDLDWLLHLDADELLYLEGAGRGGATLAEHLAAAEAAGWPVVRYVNHELLLPWRPGEPARFKRNPAMAAARLGPAGWRRLARHLDMEQDALRPYFRAYWNGKSAVAVTAAAAAAGVHGWRAAGGGEEPLLAGPSVLHFHLPTAEAFRRKYLLVAEAADDPGRPFPPSSLERAAVSRLRELRLTGASAAAVTGYLDRLYAETTAFTPAEVGLLEAAGLLFTPRVAHLPLPGPVLAGRV